MLREIKGSQRNSRVLAFRVNGTGTAAILEGSFDAAITDNGVGDWTLTFTLPFTRVPVVVCSPSSATGDIILTKNTTSISAVQIKGWDGTDGTTAKDAIFDVIVYGFDSADQT